MIKGVSFITAEVSDEGQRLDNFLLKKLKGVPKSHIYRIIRSGEVRVNKGRPKVHQRLVDGDIIRIPPLTRPEVSDIPVFIGSDRIKQLSDAIIYEDAMLIVLNKPSGIAVHGGSGLSFGVIEAMRQLRPDCSFLELVHRLDKDTSGCLLIAKKSSFLKKVHLQLLERRVKKTYVALVDGSWTAQKKVLVKAPLKKITLANGERRVFVSDEGKPSETSFQCMEQFSNAAYLQVSPKTGRTHQIRVHSVSLGHPIIGDDKYNLDKNEDNYASIPHRLYLHAASIAFTLDDKTYAFDAPLDELFNKALTILRRTNEGKS